MNHNHHQASSQSSSYSSHQHAGHSVNMLRRRFWICLALTVIVIYFSDIISGFLNYQPISFWGSQWIAPFLSVIIFVYGGLVFIKGAISEIKSLRPGMMTLISLAIIVAFLYSLAVNFGLLEGMDFWWELTTLITIMLLGHWLESIAIRQTRSSLDALAKLIPDTAEIIENNKTRIIPVSDLKVGHELMIRPGGRIPIDSQVTSGSSEVDESMISGESRPVLKQIGSQLIGGTINNSGALAASVTKVGDSTVLAGIMKLVAESEASQSNSQVLADKFAGILFFAAVTVAGLTALIWTISGQTSASFIVERVVTVLVTACPHALGLAVPLVTLISTSLAAQSGLLIRRRQALENAHKIDYFLFDKTGTLTTGQQSVVGVSGRKDTLALAASIEQFSEHPLSRAIMKEASKQKVRLPSASGFAALQGQGATAKIGGIKTYIGGPQLLNKLGVSLPKKHYGIDGTVVYVIQNRKIIGQITLADTIRPESYQAIQDLHTTGQKVAIITGDSRLVTAQVAYELNIDKYHAELLPADKIEVVKELQHNGQIVAFVGDGINDAPALVQADIGIAIGAGSDIAIESADIIIASSDPRSVGRIVKLSRATYRKTWQNLIWGAGYNIIAIPLSTGIIPSLTISPLVGAILMSLSTIIVALNAQTLRLTKLDEKYSPKSQ